MKEVGSLQSPVCGVCPGTSTVCSLQEEGHGSEHFPSHRGVAASTHLSFSSLPGVGGLCPLTPFSKVEVSCSSHVVCIHIFLHTYSSLPLLSSPRPFLYPSTRSHFQVWNLKNSRQPLLYQSPGEPAPQGALSCGRERSCCSSTSSPLKRKARSV